MMTHSSKHLKVTSLSLHNNKQHIPKRGNLMRARSSMFCCHSLRNTMKEQIMNVITSRHICSLVCDYPIQRQLVEMLPSKTTFAQTVFEAIFWKEKNRNLFQVDIVAKLSWRLWYSSRLPGRELVLLKERLYVSFLVSDRNYKPVGSIIKRNFLRFLIDCFRKIGLNGLSQVFIGLVHIPGKSLLAFLVLSPMVHEINLLFEAYSPKSVVQTILNAADYCTVPHE